MAFTRKNIIRNNEPFNNVEYNQLFVGLYAQLCNYGFCLVGEKEIAEDIVQDQFVYLWENWERLKNIDSIKGYLFRAVRNRSISYLKQQSKIRSFDSDDGFSALNYQSNPIAASDIVENHELELIIEKAIEQLPARCRTIFMLKRFDEMSNKEIAEELNISIKTVEAQMTIALKRLYEFVARHWEFFLIYGVLILVA